MKRTIFFIIPFFICATCAPRIDYYRPVDNLPKKFSRDTVPTCEVLYGPIHLDSLQIYANIISGSLPHEKSIYAILIVTDPYQKSIELNPKRLYITSRRLDTIKFTQTQGKKEFYHNPYDSIVYCFGKTYPIGDFKWYRKMKKKDTLYLHIEINNKKIELGVL